MLFNYNQQKKLLKKNLKENVILLQILFNILKSK